MGILENTPNPFRESTKQDLGKDMSRRQVYQSYTVLSMLEIALKLGTRELQELYIKVEKLASEGKYTEILQLIESYNKD